MLATHGVPAPAAEHLASTWLTQGDFLSAEIEGAFDAGMGNPPYLRLERVPEALMAAYRARYRTLAGRADLYVPFYERTLRLLGDGGRLVFICADRWTKNSYGGPLRRLVAEGGFRLRATVRWRGLGVVNPHADEPGLVRLADYPRLRRYLEPHRERLAGRHCARKTPSNWYRTIDRIHPELARTPKLLIPDIKGKAHIVYEDGRLYPHHNLYFITSSTWDLHALQAVLLSGIAGLFVAAYSTRMRGDYLRFQAQHLRRIRLPRWEAVPDRIRDALRHTGGAADTASRDAAVAELYGLSPAEQAAVFGGRNAA